MLNRQAAALLAGLAVALGCFGPLTPAIAGSRAHESLCDIDCKGPAMPPGWSEGYVSYSGPKWPIINIPIWSEAIDYCAQYKPIVDRNGQVAGWRPHRVC